MAQAVIVYKEYACGKSHHAKELAVGLGCSKVVEGLPRDGKFQQDTLYLYNMKMEKLPPGVKQIDFYEACKMVGIVPKSRDEIRRIINPDMDEV